MALKIGIVGLPNVGKSTLFNALLRARSAPASNYPFCTIDPNVGIVEVPDERLSQISEIVKPEKTTPTIIEFKDIAGLVKGASKGEGLGNQFLSHIRECHAIAQVIRTFEAKNISHIHDTIDPKRDVEIVETELILADLQTLEKRLQKSKTEAKSGDKKLMKYVALLEKLQSVLNSGQRAAKCELTEEEKEELADLYLLTSKPVIYIANCQEEQIGKIDAEKLQKQMELKDKIIPVCAKTEEDLIGFSQEEMQEYLKELELEETGLNALIKEAYKTLDLETFFTITGGKEVRAWTIKKGTLAPKAAGIIHTDFEKGFIKADVVPHEHFLEHGGETGVREKGLLRSEGKNYRVQDGDIIHFKFS